MYYAKNAERVLDGFRVRTGLRVSLAGGPVVTTTAPSVTEGMVGVTRTGADVAGDPNEGKNFQSVCSDT